MSKLLRIASLILALLLVVSLFSACGQQTTVSWESYDDVSYVTVSGEEDENGDADADTQSSKTDKTDKTSSTASKVQTQNKDTNGRFDNLNYKGKTVKLLVWYNPDQFEQDIYDQFEKITGAKIKFVQVGTSDNKLAALVAANDAPDAAMMTQENFPSYITKKLVQPLTKFIDKSKDTWLAYDIMDDIRYNNEYYGITDHFWGDTLWVYYNKDLFDKNLEIDKDPGELYKEGKWTWDTFYDLAAKMTIKDKQGNITQYGSIGVWTNAFALSAGANVITTNNGKMTNTLNTQQMKDAAAMEKKLNAGGYFQSAAGDFSNGNVAMYFYPQYPIRSPSMWKKNTFNWDVVPFPTYTGGTHYNPAAYQFGVVPKKAKNAEMGYMLLNYRAYCQENMTTLTETPAEWKAMYKKIATGKTNSSLDIGVLGGIWGLYSELADSKTNTQTTIDSWIPKIDGKIKEYEKEMESYK